MVDCSHLNGEIVVGRVSEGYYVMVFGSQGQQVYRSDWQGVPPYHAPFSTSQEAYQWGYDWARARGYPDPPIPPVGCGPPVADITIVEVTAGNWKWIIYHGTVEHRSGYYYSTSALALAEAMRMVHYDGDTLGTVTTIPLVPTCNEGEYIEPIDCPDGSVIYAKVCQGGQWVDSGYVCPTQPSGNNTVLLIGGGLAVAAVVAFLLLRK